MARFSLVLGIVAAVTALTFIVATGWTAEASHAGGMDLMAIDMDPVNIPANTNASIGTIETCARTNKNAIQDADEDAVDRIDIDIVAGNVPVGFEMYGFAFDLSYPSSSLFVTGRDFSSFMIDRISGSVGVDVSEFLPDSDGSFTGGAIDFGNGLVHESGDGTLMRVTLETAATPAPGVYPLTLTSNVHVDPASNMHSPDVTQNATVAVDIACPSGPTPTATPAPTPTPTPTPSPAPPASPTGTPTPSPTSTPTPAATPTPTPTPSPTPTALSESQTPAPTHTPAPAALPAALPPTGTGPATGDGTALAILLLVGGALITAGAWVAWKNESHA